NRPWSWPTEAVMRPSLPPPLPCPAIPPRPTDRLIARLAPIPYYFATPPGRNASPAFSQKPRPLPATFDFSIPGARLLLTQLSASHAPNSPASPPRFSPLRILSKGGLTNGVLVVMIDWVDGTNHRSSRGGARASLGEAGSWGRRRGGWLARVRCEGSLNRL